MSGITQANNYYKVRKALETKGLIRTDQEGNIYINTKKIVAAAKDQEKERSIKEKEKEAERQAQAPDGEGEQPKLVRRSRTRSPKAELSEAYILYIIYYIIYYGCHFDTDDSG